MGTNRPYSEIRKNHRTGEIIAEAPEGWSFSDDSTNDTAVVEQVPALKASFVDPCIAYLKPEEKAFVKKLNVERKVTDVMISSPTGEPSRVNFFSRKCRNGFSLSKKLGRCVPRDNLNELRLCSDINSLTGLSPVQELSFAIQTLQSTVSDQ